MASRKCGTRKCGTQKGAAKNVKKTVKKTVTKTKTAAKKTATKKTVVKKTVVKKTATKKTAVEKTAAKKSAAKKTVVKKTAVKKTATKKTAVKKTTAKKTVAKKATPQKAAPQKTVAKKAAKKRLTLREKKFQSIRQLLLEQKEAILNEAESAMNALPEQTVFPDLGDQASAETDRSFMLRLRGREQRLLNKIEEAIERIDKGEFGVCDSCGEEITVQRLIARPVANLCIDCKEEQEEEEKLQAV
jgi:DnaK suppressor protein